MFKKVILTLMLAVMFVSALSATAFANQAAIDQPGNMDVTVYWSDPPVNMPNKQSAVSIKINGELVSTDDIEPVVTNGVTFVPVTFVYMYMADTMSTNDNGVVYFDGDKVVVDINTGEITRNGLVMINDFPPYARQNTVMVPLRTMANAFNFRISWEGSTRTVLLTRPEGRTPDNVWLFSY